MMDVNKLIQNNRIAVMRRNIEENITNNINEIIKYVVDKAFNEGYQCGKDDAYAELNPSDERMKMIINISDEIYRHAKDGSEDSNDEWNAMRAIANGTPIPERH